MGEITVRVVTFNIKHGATMRGDFDLDRIANVIRALTPDFVALQEVDVYTVRARGLDIAAELARRTGMVSVFGKAMDFDGGAYGLALLSHVPFVTTQCEALPFSGENEPRAALAGTATLAGGETVRVISTHLAYASPADRLAQAAHIDEVFGADSVPTVLAGDFNATPESDVVACMKQRWSMACGDSPSPTFPSVAPTIKIDYIFFRPANRWCVQETRVVDNPIASDHCAYLTVLALKDE